MEGIYLEFENENALRSYPFAAGLTAAKSEDSEIPPGVFVDAALYPVNPSGNLYLSGISEDGVFSISDDSGVIMTGSPSGDSIEFHDISELRRHVGTLVSSSAECLGEFAGRGVAHEYSAANTTFAASCVFPVVMDGVITVDVSDSGMMAGNVGFSNGDSDVVRVSSATLEDGRDTLRFDVLPRPEVEDESFIRRVICVVDGKTPFRIHKLYDPNHPENYGYNTVILSLEGIDKDAVCADAHREGDMEMFDTCECSKPPLPSDRDMPEAYQLEEVFVPPDPSGSEGGTPNGADNAFYLVVPNYFDAGMGGVYRNPISITLEDGGPIPKTDGLEVVVDGLSAEVSEGEMEDEVSSKGVTIQVPGISGGST